MGWVIAAAVIGAIIGWQSYETGGQAWALGVAIVSGVLGLFEQAFDLFSAVILQCQSTGPLLASGCEQGIRTFAAAAIAFGFVFLIALGLHASFKTANKE